MERRAEEKQLPRTDKKIRLSVMEDVMGDKRDGAEKFDTLYNVVSKNCRKRCQIINPALYFEGKGMNIFRSAIALLTLLFVSQAAVAAQKDPLQDVAKIIVSKIDYSKQELDKLKDEFSQYYINEARPRINQFLKYIPDSSRVKIDIDGDGNMKHTLPFAVRNSSTRVVGTGCL